MNIRKSMASARRTRPAIGQAALLSTALAALLALNGCAMLPGSVSARAPLAQSIAETRGMTMETVASGPFMLTAWVKITRPGAPAAIYIEGDGQAWLSRGKASLDPTPTDPVALRLATVDPSANVIYLARPCQYSKMTTAGPCPQRYWTTARLATEVITAMNGALDTLRTRHGFTSMTLNGYSGGGGVAVLIAARRDDIDGLRTIAGNIDHGLFTRIHNITPMTGSVEPLEAARTLRDLPQIHFSGAEDRIVPASIAESFAASAGNPPCTSLRTIADVSHDKGWVERWPGLVAKPPSCPQE